MNAKAAWVTIIAMAAALSHQSLAQIVTVVATADAREGPLPTKGVFTFFRTGATALPLRVDFSGSGTASVLTDHGDFDGTPVFIMPGFSSATVEFFPVNDDLWEPTETVTLTITPSSAYTIGSPSSATVNIIDDDPPSVSVVATDAAAREPNDSGTFTFTRVGPLDTTLTATVSFGGTARAGEDYVALAPTVTFAPGEHTVARRVAPIDDLLLESNETVVATVIPGPGYTNGVARWATVTLMDDDTPVVSIEALDAEAGEPSNTARFRLTRVGLLSGSTPVNILVGGTATSGADYQSLGNSVTFGPGQDAVLVTLTPIDDDLAEPTETVSINVRPGQNYLVGSPSHASATILDNDLPTVTVAATDSSAGEPNSAGAFRFSRSGPITEPLTANIQVAGSATPGADYAALPNLIAFPKDARDVTVYVTPVDDAALEGIERVEVSVVPGPGYRVGSGATATAAVTIQDNDEQTVSVAASDSIAGETTTHGSGMFTFTRSGAISQALTVHFLVTGTAIGGSDYTAIGTSVSFAAGAATAAKKVTVTNDTLPEDSETVIVTLAPSAAYYVGTAAATVTIHDNDPTQVRVTAVDPAAAEPGETGAFKFERLGPTSAALTVNIAVSGTATGGTDYTALGATVTFAAGSAEASLTVSPRDDSDVENTESVTVKLLSGSGYVVKTPSSATVQIWDNDPPVITVTATDASAAEPTATGTFTFSRTGPKTASLTVNISASGTATSGADYTALGTTVSFAAGSATATKKVTPKDDALAEGDETVVVTVVPGLGYAPGAAASATVTIQDNETSTLASVGEKGSVPKDQPRGAAPKNRAPSLSPLPNATLPGVSAEGILVALEATVDDPDAGQELTASLWYGNDLLDTQVLSSPAESAVVRFGELQVRPGAHTLKIEVSDGIETASTETTVTALPIGDLNADGYFDGHDIELLEAALRDGGTDPAHDLNRDGAVDAGDLNKLWQSLMDSSASP